MPAPAKGKGDSSRSKRRGRVVVSASERAGFFDSRRVLHFGRQSAQSCMGCDCRARFFLAGGAFKTLLTGRPPRDLDLWAPTPGDRDALIGALLEHGAKPLPRRPFAEAFACGDRVVEVPIASDTPFLEQRLASFDIALSAIGVEHRPTGMWRAVVDPLARESVRRRVVLLLKPLVNWKYCLTTLERMRRYAEELGYEIPEVEEAAIWEAFDAQALEMQQGMLERFDLTSSGGYGVREEALSRMWIAGFR